MVAFIIALVLFVGSFYLFGLAFTATEFQALIFFAGIVAVSLGFAVPLHFRRSR